MGLFHGEQTPSLQRKLCRGIERFSPSVIAQSGWGPGVERCTYIQCRAFKEIEPLGMRVVERQLGFSASR